MMLQTMFKLFINGKGLIFYFAPRRKARGFRLLTKEEMPWLALGIREWAPLIFYFFQNLTFIKKYRKIIKKKERVMLFGNISNFCLKIAFEKA
jgi:hypothetical protein